MSFVLKAEPIVDAVEIIESECVTRSRPRKLASTARTLARVKDSTPTIRPRPSVKKPAALESTQITCTEYRILALTAHAGEDRRASDARQPQTGIHAPIRRKPGKAKYGRQACRLARRELVVRCRCAGREWRGVYRWEGVDGMGGRHWLLVDQSWGGACATDEAVCIADCGRAWRALCVELRNGSVRAALG